jgi:hypothetical protein
MVNQAGGPTGVHDLGGRLPGEGGPLKGKPIEAVGVRKEGGRHDGGVAVGVVRIPNPGRDQTRRGNGPASDAAGASDSAEGGQRRADGDRKEKRSEENELTATGHPGPGSGPPPGLRETDDELSSLHFRMVLRASVDEREMIIRD